MSAERATAAESGARNVGRACVYLSTSTSKDEGQLDLSDTASTISTLCQWAIHHKATSIRFTMLLGNLRSLEQPSQTASKNAWSQHTVSNALTQLASCYHAATHTMSLRQQMNVPIWMRLINVSDLDAAVTSDADLETALIPHGTGQDTYTAVRLRRARAGLHPLKEIVLNTDKLVADSIYDIKPYGTYVRPSTDQRSESSLDHQLKSFNHVALGGTFDHLHTGHKIFLAAACLLAKSKVTVGVSGPELLTKKRFADQLESIDDRLAGVKSYLSYVAPSGLDFNLPVLHEPYGPTITDASIDCLVVTPETKGAADKICQLRADKGLPAMASYVVPFFKDASQSDSPDQKLSSTTIRQLLESSSATNL